MDDHHDDHTQGLAHHLDRLRQRRRLLLAAAGAAGATLLGALGCGGGDTESSTSSSSSGSGSSGSSGSGSGSGSCTVAAEETEGPFPADGSNAMGNDVVNALATTGIVRSDIRPSFGDLSGTAEGVPTTVKLTLVNTGASCASLAGYAIYIWHCDRQARRCEFAWPGGLPE